MAANLGDRRTGVLSLALTGVFDPFADPRADVSRLGAPNRLGVLRGVFPSALSPFAPSLGDVLSTSPFMPLFSGSFMNVDAASVDIACALHPLAEAPARTRVPRGVANARGAALSKYDSAPASATSGSASKSQYLGAVNSHLRRARERGVSRRIDLNFKTGHLGARKTRVETDARERADDVDARDALFTVRVHDGDAGRGETRARTPRCANATVGRRRGNRADETTSERASERARLDQCVMTKENTFVLQQSDAGVE